VREVLARGIKRYNRYRAPEAVAKLLTVEGDEFEVEFSGPFRFSCCFYDYIDDLRYELEDLGVKVEVVSVEENTRGAVARFRLVK